MTELHVVGIHEELSIRNGSAVLTVARRLAEAARSVGTNSQIAGGVGRSVDLLHCVELLEPGKAAHPVQAAIGRLSKAFFGVSLHRPEEVVDHVDMPANTVFLHNRPWDGVIYRTAFPDATLVLYLHNRVMRGVTPRAMRRALREFDQIICVSDFIAHDLAKRARLGKIPSITTHTVRNASPGDTYDWNAPRDVDVLFIGRMVKYKGPHVVLRAARASDRSWRMKLIGGAWFFPGSELTRYEHSLRKMAKKLGSGIEFTGAVPPARVRAAIERAQVVVVPSLWGEPCPLSLLEAMESPAAVIATSVGGMVEFGTLGGIRFVPPGDANSLATAINAYLDDPEQRGRDAAKGAEEVAQRPWIKAYEELTRALACRDIGPRIVLPDEGEPDIPTF